MKKKMRILTALLAAVLLALPLGAHAQSVEEDAEFVTESLNGYLLGYMSWGVKSMGLDDLQEKLEKSGKQLPEVRVAVIDSGLNTSNRYLKGRYVTDGYNFVSNNTDYNDDQYHGTMVSGIIADGTSSNVKILPIKVNDASGRGYMSNVRRGILYAIEHHADVINLSISSEDPNRSLTVLDDAIEAALRQNIIIVCAAGNQSGDTDYRYPARKTNILTITSVDKNNKIADSANTGSSVDFALPGEKVFAPYKTYALTDSGTSLAAPHAAAAAALLKTWDKTLNLSEVKEILKQYAVDLGKSGFDTTYGWGMLDVGKFNITTPVKTRLRGDVTRDDRFDVRDVTAIQRHLADFRTDYMDEPAADYNGDGAITVLDATQMQEDLAQ